MAADTLSTRTTKSISFSANAEPEKSSRDENLKQAEIDVESELIKIGLREDATINAASISTSSIRAAQLVSRSTGTAEIIIYDVSTELISDLNYDGFYHRFSVSIDADTVYDISYVYAKIYLSYEGGPWNYYASSDNYHIHGDSELDSFIIETELSDGFPPGYYDMRIEVYDADYDEWLLSYGPYDDMSLSALPLEDSYHDDFDTVVIYPVETEIVFAGHGGSMSWWLLLVPILIAVTRRFGI